MGANPRQGRRKVQVLDYVHRTVASEGQPPSYGMICQELGIGTRTEVCRYVRQLEKEGHLARVGRGKVRRIRLA
jgi:SOS-response transcriptional repressor LexA